MSFLYINEWFNRYSIRLEKKANNHEDFSLQLKHFDPSTYYQNAPQNIKKCIKKINRKVIKKRNVSDSGKSQSFCRINLNYYL